MCIEATVDLAAENECRLHVIGLGFAVFAAVYLGFGLAGGTAVIWPLFAVYGLHMALTAGESGVPAVLLVVVHPFQPPPGISREFVSVAGQA